MKLKRSIGTLLLSGILYHTVNAQAVDTIMTLDTVSIASERYVVFSVGQKALELEPGNDIRGRALHLGNLLSENSSVYVRSYGQSSITSLSIRGTSSAQSGIFWNGINIRMPSLGTSDLSLMPAYLFNGATLVYGGSSIRYGSGTIGGAVFLGNRPDFSGYSQAGINLYGGSYGELGTAAEAVVSRKKAYLRLAVVGQQARNDFPYKDSRGERRLMQNAAYGGLGLSAHGALMISQRSRLELFLWYQEALRELPPTTSMERSEAYQSDRAFRSSLQWKSVLKSGVVNVKTAWFTEYENFTDPAISLQSGIETDTWYAEAEYVHHFRSATTLEGGVSMQAELADVDAYLETANRQLYSGFMNLRQHIMPLGWDLLAGIRQELSREANSPFTPALGLEGPVTKWLGLKLNISRNYRLPTLNEMYWMPGGNENLKPEQSWNAEITATGSFMQGSPDRSLEFSGSIFSSLVDDWIMWRPAGSLWYAANIQKVWARGAELDAGFRIGGQQKFARLSASYTYSLSTNESDSLGSAPKGKQIIYTPLHRASGRAVLASQGWELYFSGNFTGLTFTSSDNERSLPGFFTSDIALGKAFSAGKGQIRISFRVNNIFDTEYQVVAYRPMPGRTYHLSFSLTLNKQKNAEEKN